MLITESELSRCIDAANQKSGCSFDKTIEKWSITIEGQFKYGLILTITYDTGEWKDFKIYSVIDYNKLSRIITRLKKMIMREIKFSLFDS